MVNIYICIPMSFIGNTNYPSSIGIGEHLWFKMTLIVTFRIPISVE